MKTDDDLVLEAFEAHLKLLTNRASRAATEADECQNAYTTILKARQEAVQLINETDPKKFASIRAKLDELSKIEARALRYSKKDLVKLLYKQSDAEIERDRFVSVIANHKWRMGLRNRPVCKGA